MRQYIPYSAFFVMILLQSCSGSSSNTTPDQLPGTLEPAQMISPEELEEFHKKPGKTDTLWNEDRSQYMLIKIDQ